MHLMQPHLELLGYDLAKVMQRWYANPTPPALTTPSMLYFEIDWSGNCWLPESLLYTLPKFSALWGTELGQFVREWSINSRRPLIWADGDDSGMLIDPIVNQLANASYVSADDVATFNTLWSQPRVGFDQLFRAVGDGLHFKLPSYYDRHICAGLEYPNTTHMVMGTNGLGDCVHWDYVDAPSKWECLNDGTCAQSIDGKYFTQADCNDDCGTSKWSCMQNADKPGDFAGDQATTCVQSATGSCATLEQCEKRCGAASAPGA